ncbi:MAG: hypothetical protein IIA40_12680 [SAR324 cluster bacterium]|nr:hypothetical protein [SAR324 cluster bacterium]
MEQNFPGELRICPAKLTIPYVITASCGEKSICRMKNVAGDGHGEAYGISFDNSVMIGFYSENGTSSAGVVRLTGIG